MEEYQDEIVQDSSPDEVVEEVREDAQTLDVPAPQAEKTVPYSRFKEVNDKYIALKSNPAPTSTTALDVNEIIAINASLEGLSQREKEKLAEEHKLTGRPLSEIRQSEDFLFWQQGFQAQVDKERALKPSSTQPQADRPRKLSEVLLDPNTSPSEREKLLVAHGLYKDPGSKPPISRKVLMP